MRRSRLPLTALRSFEAAGRHQSFSKAASELAVSQAAISRQVRELEHLLGRPLFLREHRRVRLNEHGLRLLKQLSSSFDTIETVLSEIAAEPPLEQIVVSVEPTFASQWLVRKLDAFTSSRPQIEVRIEASAALADFHRKGPTLAIRHSSKERAWANAQSKHLCDVDLTPLVSPLLVDVHLLKKPEDLRGHSLLRDESSDGWLAWLTAAGVAEIVPIAGPTFSNAAIAVQSAEAGNGVALGSKVLNRPSIEDGRLIAPFDFAIAGGAYWLVTRSFQSLGNTGLAFCEWISDEMATFLSAQPGAL